MKICFVCNEYPPRPHGGLGTVTQSLAHGLAAQGHSVTVLGWDREASSYWDKEIHVVVLAGFKRRFIAGPCNRLQLWHWLKRQKKEEAFDIIETPEFQGVLPFSLSSSCVIVRLHQSSTSITLAQKNKASRSIRFWEKQLLAAHPRWIAVSHFALLRTIEVFGLQPKESSVIYNPAPELPPLAPISRPLPNTYILFLGSVSALKGAFAAAAGCRSLLEERNDLHLIYAGALVTEGRRQPEKRIYDILGQDCARRCHFLGRLPHQEAMSLLARSQLLLLPSYLEAFSMAPLEAMACGVPVLYSKLSSGREIIEDGVNGFLVDPEDFTEIGKKVRILLDDTALRLKFVSEGKRTLAERFSLERCVKETILFYEKCLRR